LLLVYSKQIKEMTQTTATPTPPKVVGGVNGGIVATTNTIKSMPPHHIKSRLNGTPQSNGSIPNGNGHHIRNGSNGTTTKTTQVPSSPANTNTNTNTNVTRPNTTPNNNISASKLHIRVLSNFDEECAVKPFVNGHFLNMVMYLNFDHVVFSYFKNLMVSMF